MAVAVVLDEEIRARTEEPMNDMIAGLLAEMRHAEASRDLTTLPASSRVYEDLHRRIVNLVLPPGTTLSRGALAREYGVSQSPVREALQRLEQDGLIKTYPQSRTVVTCIDIDQLREVHVMRIALETEIVRRFAEAPDRSRIDKARAILKLQEMLVGMVGEMDLFHHFDEAFHQALFAGVGRARLHAMLRTYTGHLARARRLDLPREGKMRQVVREHEAIIAAIAKGDGAAADAAMRAHMTSSTLARLDALREERPEYFSDAEISKRSGSMQAGHRVLTPGK